MPQYTETILDRKETYRRIGHLSQIGGVQLLSFEDGPARGVRFLEFRTGTGLIFKAALDRGLDIGYCEYRGRSLSWIPPTQLPSPWLLTDQEGFGWLRTALGGLINTCGLVHIGNPAEMDVSHYRFLARTKERYGVHDRIALTPARLIEYGERWQGDACELIARGEIVQAQVFGENLRLTRTIRAQLGESNFSIADHVENLGTTPSRHMLLYHINLGFPFVRAGGELIVPTHSNGTRVLAGEAVDPSDAYHVTPPRKDEELQVFQHEVAGDKEGWTWIALVNRTQEGGITDGVSLSFNTHQLPIFIQSRLMGEGFYSVILEPATNGMSPEEIKAAGDRIWLQPGEARDYHLRISVLDGEEEVTGAVDQIDRLR